MSETTSTTAIGRRDRLEEAKLALRRAASEVHRALMLVENVTRIETGQALCGSFPKKEGGSKNGSTKSGDTDSDSGKSRTV